MTKRIELALLVEGVGGALKGRLGANRIALVPTESRYEGGRVWRLLIEEPDLDPRRSTGHRVKRQEELGQFLADKATAALAERS